MDGDFTIRAASFPLARVEFKAGPPARHSFDRATDRDFRSHCRASQFHRFAGTSSRSTNRKSATHTISARFIADRGVNSRTR